MSWSAPRTWVTGEVVTAAMLNQHLRDNLIFVEDPPAARISGSSASVATGTTPIAIGSMPTVGFDSSPGDAMTATANKITCVQAGLYAIWGQGVWGINATGVVRRLGLIFAVAGVTEAVTIVEHSSSTTVEQVTFSIKKLAVNDTVELAGAQASGSSLALQNPSLAVSWLGAG